MTGESRSAMASDTTASGKKYFTIGEANRALPYVAGIVEDVTSCYQHAIQMRTKIDDPSHLQDRDKLNDEYELAMGRLDSLNDELHLVGVELKDFERGLLDFPALHDDREIYLCWHRGEEKIQAWHEVDVGYAGRQDVVLLHDHD